MSERSLDGKVAIVTGAGRGIGRAIAHAFAVAGASVVVNDTGGAIDGSGTDHGVADTVVDEITEAGGRAIADYSSVADRSSAGEIIDLALSEFRRIDVLVNNAGIARQNMIWDMPESDFDAMLATHVKGAWNCMSAAVPHFIEQRAGCILNVSSGVAIIGAVANTGYSTAKAGVIGLTLGAALDLGPYGIRVNVIFPAGHSRLDGKPEPWRDRYPTHPRPTMDPAKWPLEAVPPLFVYLASDAARDINGQLLACGANSVSWYPVWMPTREITTNSLPFTYDELAARVPGELLVDAKNPSPAQGEDRVWQWTRLDALPPGHNPEEPRDSARAS
jgi:NAD(P)-dependent dehydrogenase (short-subunit alcohol dehydrogenase family)